MSGMFTLFSHHKCLTDMLGRKQISHHIAANLGLLNRYSHSGESMVSYALCNNRERVIRRQDNYWVLNSGFSVATDNYVGRGKAAVLMIA